MSRERGRSMLKIIIVVVGISLNHEDRVRTRSEMAKMDVRRSLWCHTSHACRRRCGLAEEKKFIRRNCFNSCSAYVYCFVRELAELQPKGRQQMHSMAYIEQTFATSNDK
jgi:hypothetical protein